MSSTRIKRIQKPNFFQSLLKPIFDLKDTCKVVDFYKKINPQKIGDGHPVIIIPGYVKGMRSVSRLRKFINRNNYQAHIWRLDKEVGNSKNFNRLSEKVETLYAKTNEPISLIGWSLGGFYMRLLAKKHPEKIRQIISLNSPFNGTRVIGNTEWWFSIVYGGIKVVEIKDKTLKELEKPVSVPSTALYSKEDDLVSWKSCMEKEENEITQNIEIEGTHIEVVFHKNVLPIILDRLQYKKENWKKYVTTMETMKEEIIGGFTK